MDEPSSSKELFFPNISLLNVFGCCDSYLRIIEEEFNIKIVFRNDILKLEGGEENLQIAESFFNHLADLDINGEEITEKDLRYAIKLSHDNMLQEYSEFRKNPYVIHTKMRKLVPKTLGQYHYVKMIDENDIVFSTGPAGSGKTYLAVAMAVQALFNRAVSRIILVRPAVEAGERLGFLPGDMKEKVDPYLRPIYDALYDMIPYEKVKNLLEQGIIEIAPLAFMRGRTLGNAFVILDEAQNTTLTQMEMFLTRIGVNSKAIITGDITQIDLPRKGSSGLVIIRKILSKIDGIAFVNLSAADIMRHRLVQNIVRAFKKYQDKPQISDKQSEEQK